LLDEHTVRDGRSVMGEGESKSDAQINAGGFTGVKNLLMKDVGELYRDRISPWSDTVSRRLFTGGSSHIRAGRRAAVAGDWESAYRRWKTAAKKHDSDSPRAWLNLAVLHEQKGNLKVARNYASRAAHATNKDWIHAYVSRLEESIEKKKRLGQQLGPETDE
jgi:tetratricopeptide (TPR) repeat protein